MFDEEGVEEKELEEFSLFIFQGKRDGGGPWGLWGQSRFD